MLSHNAWKSRTNYSNKSEHRETDWFGLRRDITRTRTKNASDPRDKGDEGDNPVTAKDVSIQFLTCGAALEGGVSRLISQAGDNFLANIREKTNVRTHDSLCKRILKQKRQDWWNSHHALLFWPLVCLVCLPGNI